MSDSGMGAVPGVLDAWAGKTAVVTGASSGIGAGLAMHCAQLGMNVALADVDEAGLATLASRIAERPTANGANGAAPGQIMTALTDVAKPDSVEALAEAVYQRFGGVHLLFNNAGVLVDGLSWERPLADWRWTLDVNLFGVVHGIRSFVPRMLEGGESGRVVNTASLAGLIVGPFLGPYTASKHAVVGLSETLQYEFEAIGCALRASVLCPGEVRSGIMRSERLRDPGHAGGPAERSEAGQAMHQYLVDGVARGMLPETLAEYVFDRLGSGHFWLLPHPEFVPGFQSRAESIVSGENPVSGL